MRSAGRGERSEDQHVERHERAGESGAEGGHPLPARASSPPARHAQADPTRTGRRCREAENVPTGRERSTREPSGSEVYREWLAVSGRCGKTDGECHHDRRHPRGQPGCAGFGSRPEQQGCVDGAQRDRDSDRQHRSRGVAGGSEAATRPIRPSPNVRELPTLRRAHTRRPCGSGVAAIPNLNGFALADNREARRPCTDTRRPHLGRSTTDGTEREGVNRRSVGPEAEPADLRTAVASWAGAVAHLSTNRREQRRRVGGGRLLGLLRRAKARGRAK
jgi:hypothetical protein